MKRHGLGGVGQSTHGQDDRARKPGSCLLYTSRAMVPLAEMFGYVTALRTITSGRATSSMEYRLQERSLSKRLEHTRTGFTIIEIDQCEK